MAIGAGKYDDEATRVREATGARAVLLLVLEGRNGSGFQVQGPPGYLAQLPELLRAVAASIEADVGVRA